MLLFLDLHGMLNMYLFRVFTSIKDVKQRALEDDKPVETDARHYLCLTFVR